MRSLFLIALMMLSQLASAAWQLDGEQSFLGFASVKNEIIAENHDFTGLSGAISETGDVAVLVDMKTIETYIPIRNERMRSMLFDVARFPLATIKANVDLDAFEKLEVGAQADERLRVNINLHGTGLDRTVPVRVTRSSENSYVVSSLGPVVVNAEQFSLAEGVERLREIAGLQSIDLMVPVTFSLRFIAE